MGINIGNQQLLTLLTAAGIVSAFLCLLYVGLGCGHCTLLRKIVVSPSDLEFLSYDGASVGSL
jgi:hypothetical protein